MQTGIRQHERIIKTALKKQNLSGSFVVGKYRCSPYMACQHGCAYCDGRAERYFVEGDFAGDIVVRPNVPDKLSIEIPKLREKGFITVGSGITDAYQPVEAEREEPVCTDRYFEINLTKVALIAPYSV